MGLHEEFSAKLKTAMKEKDESTLNVLKMIRSTAKKDSITKGKELNDALYLETIEAYVKQMKRALTEYEEAGDRGAEMAAQLRFEVEYLQPFLPKLLSEDETRALVKGVIDEAGIDTPRQGGRVVGIVMKSHKGKVDPGLVKKLADELLNQ